MTRIPIPAEHTDSGVMIKFNSYNTWQFRHPSCTSKLSDIEKGCWLASDCEIERHALLRALRKRSVAASERVPCAKLRDRPLDGSARRCWGYAEGSRARQLTSLSHISTSRLWICCRYAPRKPPMLSIAASGRSILSTHVVSVSERRAGRW